MSTLPIDQAAEKVATVVEKAKPSEVAEVFAELFPETSPAEIPSASGLARHVRGGLEAEEIVDLWNVVFPQHRNVWYDEEQNEIHYDEEAVSYADTD